MSKEHRTQETQVVLGLLVDSEGVPITYELFPGNTAEVGTLLKVVDEFRRQYNIEDVTVIADSGLNQTLNLEALKPTASSTSSATRPTSSRTGAGPDSRPEVNTMCSVNKNSPVSPAKGPLGWGF